MIERRSSTPRPMIGGLTLALLVTVAAPATAGWWEVYQADATLDLAAARQAALLTVAEGPHSADAVAAAGWWFENLDNIPLPREILDVVGDQPRDPELAFALDRIEAMLTDRPPASSLATAEIAGPFGRFDLLDLHRDVVPPDEGLPPVGTPWRGETSVYRLRLRTLTGTVSPPETMSPMGVYLAAWTVSISQPVHGWLSLEAQGGVDFVVDSRQVARLEDCGRTDPGASWYRVFFDRGAHRIRVTMGSSGQPRVRVSLFDDHGRPMAVELLDSAAGPWAESRVVAAVPPAAAELEGELTTGGELSELLLAAALADGRADPVTQRMWLDRARVVAPDEPWPHLALAWYFLLQPTGSDAESNLRRVRDELRSSRSIPMAKLIERNLALRERQLEYAEGLLYELIEEHGDDPRVLREWVQEAVRRGWYGEAEQGLAELFAKLPDSRGVAELRLAALRAMYRIEERRELVRSLFRDGVMTPRLVEEFTTGCLADEAVDAIESLRDRIDDPGLDIARVRLRLSQGDPDLARAELDRARQRWGDLSAFDELQIVVGAANPDDLEQSLRDALVRTPADLNLRALAWRLGWQPFFEDFRVDVDDVIERETEAAKDVDVVLLLDQAVERIFPDGSSMYYYHGVSRAITPVGANQAATLQPMPDSLWLHARIIKPDGREIVPSDLTIRDGGVRLDDVRPGDLVEEEYVAVVPSTGAFRGGHLSPYVYRFADPERAFGLSEYLLLMPPETQVNVAGNLATLDREEFEHRGLRAVRWRAEKMPPVPDEPFSPPNQDLLPWVSYGFGVTWKDVGDAFRNRVIPVLSSSPELRDWSVPHVTAADPVEAVDHLVNAVIDEVEAGRAVLSFSSTAGESFSRRVGNRLGIVASVLADNGWEVDLVLARPRPLAGSNLEVPTLETFSEPLLRAALGGREVWIDLEEQRLGVDHIRPLLQGGDALALPLTRPTAPVTMLERLPTYPNPQLEQRTMVSAALDAAGNAQMVVEMSMRGYEEQRLRQRVEGVPPERVEAVYRQMAASLFPGATDVRGSLVPEDDGSLVRFEMSLPGACEIEQRGMICRNLVLEQPLAPVLASLPKRNFPLVLELPLLRRREVVITLPQGWTIDRPPRRLQTRWGTVDETLESHAARNESVLTLQLPPQTVTPEEYPEFARFCQAVDELMSRPLTLRRVGE